MLSLQKSFKDPENFHVIESCITQMKSKKLSWVDFFPMELGFRSKLQQ